MVDSLVWALLYCRQLAAAQRETGSTRSNFKGPACSDVNIRGVIDSRLFVDDTTSFASASYLPVAIMSIPNIVGVHEIDALSPGTSKMLPVSKGITVPSTVIDDITAAEPFAM